MKRIKGLLSLLLVIVTMFSIVVISGCKDKKEKIDVYVPDGAPALSIAKLINDDKNYTKVGKLNYNVIAGDQVVSKVTSGDADVAILPTNAASIIYNKGLKYKLVSTNVYGVLYLVGRVQVSNLEELKGKVVHSIGQGNTPEQVFKYVLDEKGIGYVNSDTAVENKIAIKYYSDASNILPLLKQGQIDFAILGEPAVYQSAKFGAINLFSLQTLWNEVTGTQGGYPQASMIVKSSVIEKYPDFINELLDDVKDNENWIKENSSLCLDLIKSKGSTLQVAFTENIINNCNVRFVFAQNAKAEIDTYLNVLKAFNPKSIGGSVPNSDFYFVKG